MFLCDLIEDARLCGGGSNAVHGDIVEGGLFAERLVKVMLPFEAPLVSVPPVAALALDPDGKVTVIAVDVVRLQPFVLGTPVVMV